MNVLAHFIFTVTTIAYGWSTLRRKTRQWHGIQSCPFGPSLRRLSFPPRSPLLLGRTSPRPRPSVLHLAQQSCLRWPAPMYCSFFFSLTENVVFFFFRYCSPQLSLLRVNLRRLLLSLQPCSIETPSLRLPPCVTPKRAALRICLLFPQSLCLLHRRGLRRCPTSVLPPLLGRPEVLHHLLCLLDILLDHYLGLLSVKIRRLFLIAKLLIQLHCLPLVLYRVRFLLKPENR
jgi:hypothetical protein